MKTRTIFVLVLSLIGLVSVSKAQTANQSSKAQNISTDKIEVYYFHYERRCATCMAVENESKKALEELYPEKMKSGEIIFLSVNIEEESNKPLAEKYKVDGQTLLVTRGDKQENLTNTAFMYATTKPEKLKKAIGDSIEKL
jgi:hypothetical protein